MFLCEYHSVTYSHATIRTVYTILSSTSPTFLNCNPCSASFSVALYMNLFMSSGAASQAGDADSSQAPCLTSGLQGSVNVHHGALLFVPQ